jgi:hypothetical protein
MQAVQSLAPQFDRVCVCLNEYDSIPPELAAFDNVEAMIPDKNLKDAGKFAFTPSHYDTVFTCDDDIIYPATYVARTLDHLVALGDDAAAIGYHAHAFVFKKQKGQYGWRNYMFHRRVANTFKIDVMGTGTACFRGAYAPSLDDCITAAGYVDLRFSRLMTKHGMAMWTIPREDDYLINNMPEVLDASSLFRSVNRRNRPDMQRETHWLLSERSKGSGEKYEKLKRDRVI